MGRPQKNVTGDAGVYLVRGPADLAAIGETHVQVVRAIRDSVVSVAGASAAERFDMLGLGQLHQIIRAEQVGELRDDLIERLRIPLLRLAVKVGRKILGWEKEFYVDDYIILRVNFPFEVARLADPRAENPGIGRVTPSMRALATSRRVVDPVFDPKGYHRDYPPAAWAHGPHLDSWAGHSKDGKNIWWAISDVPPEAGMVLYPELEGKRLPSDPRTLYLKRGYQLPKPSYQPLQPGQMLVFDPEILHGTHLNVTDQTRVVVSLRLNSSKPAFDPGCFYAREFWRRSGSIESGNFDDVLHLPRENNLAAPSTPEPVETTPPPRCFRARQGGADGWHMVCPAAEIGKGQKIVAEVDGKNVIVTRTMAGLSAFANECPHYGLGLIDGAIDGAAVFCPGCGVAFDIHTGKSRAGSLSLETWSVAERAGAIWLSRSVRS
jgi:nitrite reductase/ring-hydroxylating ferredoxin subunit